MLIFLVACDENSNKIMKLDGAWAPEGLLCSETKNRLVFENEKLFAKVGKEKIFFFNYRILKIENNYIEIKVNHNNENWYVYGFSIKNKKISISHIDGLDINKSKDKNAIRARKLFNLTACDIYH